MSDVSSGNWKRHDLSALSVKVANSPATGAALASNGEMGADLLRLPAGESFPPHVHPGNHALIVLSGYGELLLGDHGVPMEPGAVIVIPAPVPHATSAGPDEDLVWISIGSPHSRLHGEERMEVRGWE